METLCFRSYFATALDIAESKGEISHPWRQFFMGHKGDIEATYSTKKKLSEDMKEEMRQAYTKCEKHFVTTSDYTKEEREKLKRIEFDRKSIEILEDGIREHKKIKDNKVIYNRYKRMRYGIYTSTYNKIVKQTQSKANSFNYTLAHIGYIVMIEMIYENIESITQAIIQIQKISKHPAIQDIEYIKKLLEASMLLNNTPEIL